MDDLLTGNSITLLRSGEEYFPALLAAIDAAQQEIYLQTYIFEPDNTGVKVGAALKRAASRGVKVHLVLDGFGSKGLPKDYVKELRSANVEVIFYRPKISPWTLERSRLQRMHRKIAVMDAQIGFVGGINIIDDFNTPRNMAPRLDYAVQVQGPILASIHASVKSLRRRLYWKQLRSLKLHDFKFNSFKFNNLRPRKLKKRASTQSEQSQKQNVPNVLEKSPAVAAIAMNNTGNVRAKFLVRDNLWHRRDIEDAYLAAIRTAKTEIIIANAYFLPGLKFRQALHKAAKRGVRVILLLQGRVEYLLLDFASHALYSALLKQGIEIYEYHKSFMHSKVAVVDHQWAMVGSSNIDPFSLLMSREANIEIADAAFAKELRDELQLSIETGAKRVFAEDWQRGYFLRRLLSWLIYGLVRLMIGVSGYSTNR